MRRAPARPVSASARGLVGRHFGPHVKWTADSSQASDTMSVHDKIHEQVTSNPVVLYMKGSPAFPQCGFSNAAVQMLKACGVDRFFSVDVLSNPDIRQGIKEYANWPTIPQLYVNGEFVGGADIMREMYQSGELQKMLETQKA
jgi:monothiol glutaredoxin